MELIDGSETSGFRTQTPGNYPKEDILHKEHGESLKSRILATSLPLETKVIRAAAMRKGPSECREFYRVVECSPFTD